MNIATLRYMVKNLPEHEWQDAWLLFTFYANKAEHEREKYGILDAIRATSGYVRAGLGWGKARFNTAKRNLQMLDMLTDVKKDGKAYIRIKYRCEATGIETDMHQTIHASNEATSTKDQDYCEVPRIKTMGSTKQQDGLLCLTVEDLAR